MMEITMEDGMMVMNMSKLTDHSNDMLSTLIDLITNAINADIPHRQYVWTPMIVIPEEYSSQVGNEEDR